MEQGGKGVEEEEDDKGGEGRWGGRLVMQFVTMEMKLLGVYETVHPGHGALCCRLEFAAGDRRWCRRRNPTGRMGAAGQGAGED